ncbi:hypothetical protein BN946_scf184909.g59 [Trametes cinnabarina]|uniref:HTH CENPB-type domain-containing protein n=1 Tax=Pycnoporus cinnabarinus TaxID=5643 RepID=A0A060SAT2_PYCCI|nr:hypothetical protein BN946_scf184909.g59 [Trametes cinnabarina]
MEQLSSEHRAALEQLSGPLVSDCLDSDVKKRKPTENTNDHSGSQRKQNATLRQRIEILDWHHANGKKQTRTAQHFDKIYPHLKIKQPLISEWLKNEAKWRAQWDASKGVPGAQDAKWAYQTEHPQISEMMNCWVIQAREAGVLLTGSVLRAKWTSFADRAGILKEDWLSLSEGWLEAFKARHGLRGIKRHGEAGSTELTTVEAERARIQQLIRDHGYQPRDIYNMDETGLFYQMPPDQGLADRALSGVKAKKTQLTYAFTCNADSSDKLPPMVIGKYKKPRPFGGKTGAELGFDYHHNAKAWMTAVLYQSWIKHWDTKLVAQHRKILLLQDNFSGHIVPEGLRAIHVENFEPNLTPHVQPDDQGIIRCFKAHYRAKYIERAIDRYDSGISPAQIYEIDILTAMRIADAAWRAVNVTTIRHCWRRAGILPDFAPIAIPTPTLPISSLIHPPAPSDPAAPDASRDAEDEAANPVQKAEGLVTEALNGLVKTGALQKLNQMDLASLLDPSVEREVFEEISEQEIFEAVQEAACGEDQGDEEQTEVFEAPPTRLEALQAAAVLSRFTASLNSPAARNLEDILAGFTRQITSVPSSIM